MPHVDQAPTHDEDLSTKPSCQQSYVDNWGTIIAPQPWNETHLKFYYQMQAEVGEQITRVLDALRETEAYENTIVIFTSDHGDMQGAHGGMHEKWHVAYEEAMHVPFIVSSPLLPGGARELDIPTNHADLIPTLLGLTGIDPDQALARLQADHSDAHPLVGRDLSAGDPRRRAGRAHRADPVHHRRRDQRGQRDDGAARSGASPGACTATRPSSSPTTCRPSSPRSTSTASSTWSSSPATTTTRSSGPSPASATSACTAATPMTVTEPEPDEYELYDLTLDPIEERNLAHPSHADDRSRALQQTMLALLVEQLDAKRLTPSAGEVPGYRPPAVVPTPG